MTTLTLNPIVSGSLDLTANPIVDTAHPWIDPRNYGAVGDGVTDDTSAIQAAVTAAIALNGSLILPTPPVSWKITNTINFLPSGANTTFRLDVNAAGGINAIKWGGAASKSMFYIKGLKDSTWRGLKLQTPGTTSSVIGYDLDTDATYASTSTNTFIGCHFFDSGTGTGNHGWRVGNDAAASDESFYQWNNCRVSGGTNSGSYGWRIMNSNAKLMTWYTCGADHMDVCWSNDGNTNGGEFYWYACGGTLNNVDFQLYGSNTYGVYGGRWESGKRFLDTVNSSAVGVMSFDAVKLATYAPSDNIVFYLNNKPFLCSITNLQAYGADYTAAFITANNTSSGPGYLRVTGAVRTASSAIVPITLGTNATQGLVVEAHIIRTNSAQQPVNGITLAPDTPKSLTYGASVATNAAWKGPYKITVTNGTAFTVANPANPYARDITYDILNSSGGAMGAITWDTQFLLAGAFTNPANGKRRTITFYWDGTSWVEKNRAAADI